MLVEHPASFSWPLRRRHLQTRAKVIPSFVSPHRALDAALSNSGGVLVSIGSTEIRDTGFPIILLLEHSHPASQGIFFLAEASPTPCFLNNLMLASLALLCCTPVCCSGWV